MKVGLVLEGGAMRGMFTAGVLDVFLDEQIQIDEVVSVSAGALFGVNLLSCQRGRALRYNKQFLHDKRYISLKSLLTTGNIVNKEFAFYQVPFYHDVFDNARFKQSQTGFYATLTNVDTGAAEYIKITDPFAQMEALRASSAMPYVSQVVEYHGKRYLDGGIADSIPVEQCQSLGVDKTIVVLTRPLAYRKTPSNRLMSKLFYRRFPNLIKTLDNRYQEYNDKVEQIIEWEKQGKIFVIRPSVSLPIKRIEKDLSKVQAMYDLGIQNAQAELARLRAYLAK